MKKSNVIKGLFKLLLPLLHIMSATIILGVLGYLCAAAVTVSGAMLILKALGLIEAPASVIISIMLASAVLRAAARYTEQKSGHYIAFRELAIIRDKVYTVLRRIAPAKLAERGQGDLCNMVTSDIEQLEVFYAHTVAPVSIAVIVSFISLLFIGHISIYAAVTAAAAYITVGVIIPAATSKIGMKSGKRSRARLAELNDYFLESLRGLEVSMQFQNSENRRKETEKRTEELLKEQRVIKRHEGMASALTGGAVIVFTVACFIINMYISLSFEANVIASIALSATFGPVIALSNLSSTLTQTFASGERVLELLEEAPTVEEVVNGIEPDFNGAELHNVTFGYNGESVLKNLNLKVDKNSMVGIMGKSGCGKSTVLRLFMRFWKCESGRVAISDVDINDINSAHLTKLEGFMTQTTDLFHGTVLENIKIGNSAASMDEVIEACKKAAVHDFIMSLPEGYDSEVGELGETLSAGERQRIGLARAFLHNSPFLLLDEPTANLDAMNEGIILKSIKEETGKTVVISSHRKSTLSICDDIFCISTK